MLREPLATRVVSAKPARAAAALMTGWGHAAPESRPPPREDWPAICAADARAFGTTMTPEDVEDRLKMHQIDRFRVAFDRGQIVGVAASYAMDVSLPGGAIVPMGGVTWVS